jgi:S1-C subfamily serine protease
MGIRTLRAPGWLHQISPTLQRGIISAVLPFPCANPHALLLDCVVEGVSSGSPVFNEAGDVIGMVYAGIPEQNVLRGDSAALAYNTPTAHTLAVPGHLLRDIVDKFDISQVNRADLPPAQPIAKLVEDAERDGRLIRREPKFGVDPAMPPIDASEIEYPS